LYIPIQRIPGWAWFAASAAQISIAVNSDLHGQAVSLMRPTLYTDGRIQP
jgi:precorrin-4 methylase